MRTNRSLGPICASLGFFAAAACGEAERAPPTLRVATINLRHDSDWWPERFPLIAEELVSLKADLVGLQEVEIDEDQATVLRDLVLQKSGGELRYEIDEERKSGLAAFTGEGIGLFSRWPMSGREVLDLEYGRVALRRVVDLGEGWSVEIYDTHLHHEGGDAVRAPQMRKLTEWMSSHPASPRILTGDMNATPDSETILAAKEAGLDDAYVLANPGMDGFTSPVRLTKSATVTQSFRRRIDYVFVDGPIEVKSARVAFDQPDGQGLYPSDHLGVVVDLKLSP